MQVSGFKQEGDGTGIYGYEGKVRVWPDGGSVTMFVAVSKKKMFGCGYSR